MIWKITISLKLIWVKEVLWRKSRDLALCDQFLVDLEKFLGVIFVSSIEGAI